MIIEAILSLAIIAVIALIAWSLRNKNKIKDTPKKDLDESEPRKATETKSGAKKWPYIAGGVILFLIIILLFWFFGGNNTLDLKGSIKSIGRNIPIWFWYFLGIGSAIALALSNKVGQKLWDEIKPIIPWILVIGFLYMIIPTSCKNSSTEIKRKIVRRIQAYGYEKELWIPIRFGEHGNNVSIEPEKDETEPDKNDAIVYIPEENEPPPTYSPSSNQGRGRFVRISYNNSSEPFLTRSDMKKGKIVYICSAKPNEEAILNIKE
jgi:hypothetical protein